MEHLLATLELNEKGQLYLYRELSRLGIKFFPTHANFIMMLFADESEVNQLFVELQRRGVIARPLLQAGIPHGLRVTVGLESENRRFVSALEEILESRSKRPAGER